MSDTTNTLAEQLVRAAEEALDENIRNPYDARAAVAATLRELRDATDDIGPVFAKLQRGFIDALADAVESQS